MTQLDWGADGVAVWRAGDAAFLVGHNLFKHAPRIGVALADLATGATPALTCARRRGWAARTEGGTLSSPWALPNPSPLPMQGGTRPGRGDAERGTGALGWRGRRRQGLARARRERDGLASYDAASPGWTSPGRRAWRLAPAEGRPLRAAPHGVLAAGRPPPRG